MSHFYLQKHIVFLNNLSVWKYQPHSSVDKQLWKNMQFFVLKKLREYSCIFKVSFDKRKFAKKQLQKKMKLKENFCVFLPTKYRIGNEFILMQQ